MTTSRVKVEVKIWIIEQLAQNVHDDKTTMHDAACTATDLLGDPVSIVWDKIAAARKRLVSIQMQNDLINEQEDADNAKWEGEYRSGQSASGTKL